MKDSFESIEQLVEYAFNADSSQRYMSDVEVRTLLIKMLVEKPLVNPADVKNAYMLLRAHILELKIPYQIITKAIYESTNTSESEVFVSNIQILLEEAQRVDPSRLLIQSEIEKFQLKIDTHTNLALVQKEYINNSIKDVREISSKAKAELENIKTTKGQIYTEFVGILGIFSALIFGLFGGFDTLSNSISSLAKNTIPLPNVLITISILLGGLSLLIFALMQGIAQLVGKPIRSCNCEKKDECHHSIYQRHPMMSWIIIFLFSTFMFSVIWKYLPANLNKNMQSWWILGGLYLIAMIVYLIIINLRKKKN